MLKGPLCAPIATIERAAREHEEDLHRHWIAVQVRRIEKASLHGALLRYAKKTSPYAARRNFAIGNAAIYCTLVVQDIVLVEQP